MKQEMNKRTDFYYVQRALCGDQSAYQKIYRKYKNMVMWHVYKRVPDPFAIEDIVSETFTKAFDRLDTYTPIYQLSAWLVRIGRNCAIDYVRKRRLTLTSIDAPVGNPDDEKEFQLPDPDGITPEEETERNENSRRISAVLDEMPAEMAKVLRLHYVYEMPYDEVGVMCGMEEREAHRLCHRAKRLFRRLAAADPVLVSEFSIRFSEGD